MKKALNSANEDRAFVSIARDGHGITFITTPPQGSTCWSSIEFCVRNREVMGLRCKITNSLQHFCIRSADLYDMVEDFKTCWTDLGINTHDRTSDSDLALSPAIDNMFSSYQAPTVTAASAIMD